MPRKREKRKRAKRKDKNNEMVLRFRIGPLYPYDLATGNDITDVDALRFRFQKRFLDAIGETLSTDSEVGFDQPSFDIDIWTKN